MNAAMEEFFGSDSGSGGSGNKDDDGFLSFCHALHSIVEPNENGASRYDWTGLHFGARFDENLCHF
jgi:hypothetical protein